MSKGLYLYFIVYTLLMLPQFSEACALYRSEPPQMDLFGELAEGFTVGDFLLLKDRAGYHLVQVDEGSAVDFGESLLAVIPLGESGYFHSLMSDVNLQSGDIVVLNRQGRLHVVRIDEVTESLVSYFTALPPSLIPQSSPKRLLLEQVVVHVPRRQLR